MSDLDAWLDDYQAPIVTVEVCGRANLLAAHTEADAALAAAQAAAADMLDSGEVREAKRRVEQIEADIEASQKTFSFQGIGHLAWRDLKRKHPPVDDDRRMGLDCHLEAFAPAAIAASSVEPNITVEQAKRMAAKLPEGEYEKLYEAVLQANGQVMGAPKSVLAALIAQSQANGASSTTSAPEESPDLSLWDGNGDPSTGLPETTTGD